MDIKFKPIGTIYTDYKEKTNVPIQPVFSKTKGKVKIKQEYITGLKDLKGFSHIILIYYFNKSKGYSLTVKPFLDNNERGVFATRAPNRPNGIGLSVVKLEKIKDDVLHISNVDILNNTPLLDIKPYVQGFDSIKTNKGGWIKYKIKKDHHSDNRFE